jgi:hypothetical protein
VGPTPGGGGINPTVKGGVFAFNLVTEFFEEFCTNYQDVKMEKLYIL